MPGSHAAATDSAVSATVVVSTRTAVAMRASSTSGEGNPIEPVFAEEVELLVVEAVEG